jgi:formylglycine-generating enzyme required for sulfatase activity
VVPGVAVLHGVLETDAEAACDDLDAARGSRWTMKRLSLGAWDARPITYAQWIELAGEHGDQNQVWASHEYWGRRNVREDDPLYRDLGGEA